ncbi:MAG TPA: GAF domain-containing protein [Polyangiaceae bacterium]|nr:GAF domain-containing protein [Polyangiaceae bacterium]
MLRHATQFERDLTLFIQGDGGGSEAHDGEPVVSATDHRVQFYEDDESLSRLVGNFIGAGIPAGDSIVVIATESHQDSIRGQLESMGIDLGLVCEAGQLRFFDASEMLSKFMRDGEPNRDLFDVEVGGVVASLVAALSGSARLRAYSEMVDVLWKGGQRTAAIRLEELWNDLQTRHASTLLSAYAMASFYKEPAALHRVRGVHPHVIDDAASAEHAGAAQATSLPPEVSRRMARESSRRDEVERALRESLRDLRRKEEALRSSEEQLRDFVENATVGLHRVSADGTILWANRAELDLLGYTETEYVGRSIAEFHADKAAIEDILTRLGRGEALHGYAARLRAKDGSIRHVLISSNVYSQEGKFVHTRCFTRDITERRKVEEDLRRSQRQLEIITDALPVLVSYVGADRRYHFVSAAYERWFGRAKADVVGKRVEEVLGADAYQAVSAYVESALSGDIVRFESVIPFPQGGTRFIEATYIPQLAEDGQVAGYVSLVADITERKSLERFRLAAIDRAERLLKITGAIADAVTDSQVFEALVDHVASAVDASSVALWLVNEDGRTAKLVRSFGYSDAAKQQFEAVPLDATPGIPALDSIRLREPIWITSQPELLSRYPHLRAAVTAGRAYRISCLPLVAHGRVLGALGLTIEQSREAPDDERDFLLLVARYAGQAIERLRLFEAERRSRAEADAAALRMGVLNRGSRAFVETNLDLPSRLEGVVTELGTSLSSCVGIALLGPDGRLHTSAAYHPDPEAKELLKSLGQAHPLRMGEGVTGTVAQTGKSVIIPTIEPEEINARAAPSYRAFLDRFPSYAMICAPLRAAGQIIGTVTATRRHKGETYTTEDLRLFEELAERAAAAIESSRLYQETLDARSRAEQLYRFAQTVVIAQTVEQVFDAALAAIEAALGTSRSAVLTFGAEKLLRFRAWRNLSSDYRAAVEGHSPWPADATAPEPVLVPDAACDPAMAAYVSLFREEGIGALAFIPLVSRGRLLGKFMVYYDRPHTFATHELETAKAIANHLASVITRFDAVAKLEETIRQNELFAGVLAHDLRNPLGAMMIAAQLLLMRREGENGKGDRETKPLSRILSSGQRMTTMIDQLLDFTRARSGGGIAVEPHETNLADLCTQAVGELELAHPEWTIQREVVGDQRGSWDSDRLLQVLSNLVANAGQHGTSNAGISLKLDGTALHHVRVEIHNQGMIPESLQPHLFDPFRSTLHRRDQSRGLGLGLFIVREIVRAHGGQVDVSSSEPDGTTFSIVLPRHTARRAARSETSEAS